MPSRRFVRVSRRAAAAVVLAAGAAQPGIAERLVDGMFDDWSSQLPLAGDPLAEADGLAARAVAVESRGTELFIRLWIGEELNLPAGLSQDGDQIIMIGREQDSSIVPILSWDHRGRELRSGDLSAPRLNQQTARAVYAPTFASDEYELLADLAAVGVTPGEELFISVTGIDGWAAFTLDQPAVDPVRRSAERPEESQLRVVALNTLGNGLQNQSRSPQLRRLLDSVNADIYCLSEEGSASPESLASLFTSLDPREDGAIWSAVKSADQVIVSPYPMLEFDIGSSDAAAAIDHPSGRLIVVTSHPACCGYIGSPQDQFRIANSTAIANTVVRLRNGQLGPELFAYADAPVIVAGDWNLVGSRTPLDVLEDPATADLQAVTLPQLIGPTTATWREPDQLDGFFPGRLDLIAASRDRFRSLGGFVLDSETLSDDELTALGIEQFDSRASDHLLLTSDFSFEPPAVADVNADGITDAEDLYAWVRDLTDIDGNGLVGLSDLVLLRTYLRRQENSDVTQTP